MITSPSRGLSPDPLGIAVAAAGAVASVMLSGLLFSPVVILPLVCAWACVYSYAPRARDRWPWWVLGQWVSLTALQFIRFLSSGMSWTSLGISAGLAAVTTVVWMALVGLYLVQRRSWRTRQLPQQTEGLGSPLQILQDRWCIPEGVRRLRAFPSERGAG